MSGYSSLTYHPEYSHPIYDEGYTSPVKSFAANGLGLYDMTGNVDEWCGDLYYEHYYEQLKFHSNRGKTATDPLGGGKDQSGYGRLKIYRGGSYRTSAGRSQVHIRGFWMPIGGGDSLGFRIARSK